MLREYGWWPGLERVEVPVEAWTGDVPRWVAECVRDAEERAAEYEGRAGGGKFVPGDYLAVYQTLAWLREAGLTGQGRFTEWGSGQGLTTILADALGMRARGVEIDRWLVAEARHLAELHESGAEFVHGSYDRRTAGELPVVAAEEADVVYVYPWPGEEAFFLGLFEETAAEGALLVAYYGVDDIRVYRRRGEGR